MKKLLDNMWFYVFFLLAVSMGLSTLVFMLYMRGLV
jgi:hypothetical protein